MINMFQCHWTKLSQRIWDALNDQTKSFHMFRRKMEYNKKTGKVEPSMCPYCIGGGTCSDHYIGR